MKATLHTISAVLLLLITCVIEASPITVVEIANFSCPHCFAVNHCMQPVEEKIQKEGGHFDFVPIFYKQTASWSSRAYLGVSDLFKNALTHAIRTHLFEATQVEGLTLQTPLSVCDEIHHVDASIAIADCVSRASGHIPMQRLANLMTLMRHAKLITAQRGLPIFILERDHHIAHLFSFYQYHSATELCEALHAAA